MENVRLEKLMVKVSWLPLHSSYCNLGETKMSEDKNVSVDVSSLKKGEKLVYNYDEKGRVKEIKRQDDSGPCWVVTAYYGDPFHENVCKIRSLRENLIENKRFGFLFLFINELYLVIGKTEFSKYWIKKVKENNSIHQKLSKIICELLLKVANSLTERH